jgi:hypothetical protein
MNATKRFSDLWKDLKQSEEATIKEAVEILKRMRTQPGCGIAVVHAIQDYFLGPAENKSIVSINYRKRLRFLYAVDRLIQNNPDFDNVFRRIKKETSERKIGFKTNDMERRMAFIWATIEQRNRD